MSSAARPRRDEKNVDEAYESTLSKNPARLNNKSRSLGQYAMSAIGPKRTWTSALHMSAFGGKADIMARREIELLLTSRRNRYFLSV